LLFGNVRFGSFATSLVKADARTCPLLLQKRTKAATVFCLVP
jgi:hypothetical protein